MTADESPGDPRDELVEALLAMSRAMVGIAVRTLHGPDADVTIGQFRTMVVLATRGPQRLVDISAELGVNPSTGTRMTDRLVRKGLITRSRVGADRREKRISLTGSGQRVVSEVIDRRRAELVKMVSALPESSLETAVAVIHELITATGEPNVGNWPGGAGPDD